MNLIPSGLQINVETLASIADLAQDFMTEEPAPYPLAVATNFFFGTAPGVYDTLISALNPYIHGEGAGQTAPIPEPFPAGGFQPSKGHKSGTKG
jgi:hypothetical protein